MYSSVGSRSVSDGFASLEQQLFVNPAWGTAAKVVAFAVYASVCALDSSAVMCAGLTSLANITVASITAAPTHAYLLDHRCQYIIHVDCIDRHRQG